MVLVEGKTALPYGEPDYRYCPPSYKHGTLESAQLEASRLARKESAVAYVLECVGACALKEVDWEIIEP